MEKEITNRELAEMMDKLTTSTNKGFFSLQTQINGLSTDLKSFKLETSDNFKELNDKFDDMNDTAMSYDKRIETLESKVFV